MNEGFVKIVLPRRKVQPASLLPRQKFTAPNPLWFLVVALLLIALTGHGH